MGRAERCGSGRGSSEISPLYLSRSPFTGIKSEDMSMSTGKRHVRS
jgi:hypothetical protein